MLSQVNLSHFFGIKQGGATSILQAQKAVQNTLFSVIAFDDDKAIGIGRLVGDGSLIWYIQDLIVLPEYQNNGVGSVVMNRLIDFVAENGVPNSFTTIGLMSAKGKESFYQKFGFYIRPTDTQGAGMVMNKKVISTR